MRNKRCPRLVLWIAICLFLNGCTAFPSESYGNPANDLTALTIGTADSGGTMYPVGKAIAQIISSSNLQINVNLSASNGSASNVDSLANEEIDLGLVSGDIAYAALHGLDEFSENPAESLRCIAALYPSISNWMALSDSGFTYVHDLAGSSIGIGPQNSTTELSARIALQSMGISGDNTSFTACGIGSGASEVKRGNLQAIHGFAGIPISGLTALADSTPCTLLRYTDEELNTILAENTFYYRDVIPANTYAGQTEEIDSFGIKCLLCVNASMDKDLVYQLTQIIYEHTSELILLHPAMSVLENADFMYTDLPIPLHTGAKQYYQEKQLLK